MLRYIADVGTVIGVNWYLTDDDESNDGKFKDYLQNDKMRKYDEHVFLKLKEIKNSDTKVTVQDIQNNEIIPRAIFYDEMIDSNGTPEERRNSRSLWFKRSLDVLEKADIVFMDPDNGLLVKGDGSKRGAEKYVLPEEVIRYFECGHDVVYYCQRGRRPETEWKKYLNIIPAKLPVAGVIVLTYHKGTQRSYVFLLHEESYLHFDTTLQAVMFHWQGVFSIDFQKQPVVSKGQ